MPLCVGITLADTGICGVFDSSVRFASVVVILAKFVAPVRPPPSLFISLSAAAF